jgi:hypothetical protein
MFAQEKRELPVALIARFAFGVFDPELLLFMILPVTPALRS